MMIAAAELGLQSALDALQVEKHIRKNKLTAGTFSDQVGASSHATTESTDKEARKLAFFLFWNIKPTLSR